MVSAAKYQPVRYERAYHQRAQVSPREFLIGRRRSGLQRHRGQRRAEREVDRLLPDRREGLLDESGRPGTNLQIGGCKSFPVVRITTSTSDVVKSVCNRHVVFANCLKSPRLEDPSSSRSFLRHPRGLVSVDSGGGYPRSLVRIWRTARSTPVAQSTSMRLSNSHV